MTANAVPSLKLNVKKKDGPVFAADLAQAERQIATGSKRQLVLGGQLMMVSLEPLKAQSGFVPQPPRKIAGGLLGRSKSPKKLHLMLDKEVLERLVKSRNRPVFAVDALLKYGLKLKGADEHCVLGAIEATATTQVLVLMFKKQELVSYNEYQLAHSSQNTYEADLRLLLERLRQASPSAAFHWCGPVPQPRLQEFKTPDATFWLGAPTQTLSISGQPSFLRKHGTALALVGLASAGYAGALYAPYQEYRTAKIELTRESQSLKGETAFSAERLSVLRSRQALFEKQKRSELRFSRFMDILAAFAQEPGLSIKTALLVAGKDDAVNSRPGKPSEFEITVEVARGTGDVSVLDQGKPLLQALSAKTGGNLRLATGSDSYREATGAQGTGYRTYKIQGDFKNDN